VIVNSFQNKFKTVVWSKFFLLTPILIILIAFQAKEPNLSTVQIQDLDYNFVETLQTDTDHVFMSVEVLLSPPGGMDSFIQSVSDNYVHPKEAKEANVKGNLEVTFVVETDGRFSTIEVTKDLGYGIGEEIMRVLKNSRRWTPGIQSGRPVRGQYRLLISIGEKVEVVSMLQGFASNFQMLDPKDTAEATAQIDTGSFLCDIIPNPVPPGGMMAFSKWITDNYALSKEVREANVKGRLLLTFIVKVDGQLSDISLIRGIGYGIGEEVVRVLENSPKWTPSIHNRKPVQVQFTLPILFGQESGSV
jgi:hypothetical protein